MDLFTDEMSSSDRAHNVDLPDGQAVLYPDFFSNHEASLLLAELEQNIEWRQERIKIYGKVSDLPRLMAWYGEPGRNYQFSGIRVQSYPWTEALSQIKARIEPYAKVTFNSVLLNLYRQGADGVAWHSDDEAELGRKPIIGSVSFGEERLFQFKHKTKKHLRRALKLPHSSLLLMSADTQKHWLHQIPKSTKAMSPRVNLTFRIVATGPQL